MLPFDLLALTFTGRTFAGWTSKAGPLSRSTIGLLMAWPSQVGCNTGKASILPSFRNRFKVLRGRYCGSGAVGLAAARRVLALFELALVLEGAARALKLHNATGTTNRELASNKRAVVGREAGIFVIKTPRYGYQLTQLQLRCYQ
jgi:hypothetical protein